MAALTTIYMARKPLEGTVASNALKYGTGSLNIDATRLGSSGGTKREGQACTPTPQGWQNMGGHDIAAIAKGRWPANVILQHRDSCKLVGQHYEDFLINVYADATKGNFASYKDEDEERPEYEAEGNGQVVDEWQCAPGCPVLDLDEQSGVLHSGSLPSGQYMKGGRDNISMFAGTGVFRHQGYEATSGGASRYFKQVQSADELYEYLRVMISTPDDEAIITNPSREGFLAPDGSVVGLVVVGGFEEAHVAEFMRLLPPGGHLFFVAPDEQPTGHTNAIMLEEAGFEIRDCLLWVQEPGRFHYVAKAKRSEREAGCGHLKGKAGHEAVDRKEGTAGVNNPRAGAGRTAKHAKNHHPTVKPIDIMVRLLADVPKDKHVLDPFMGSGTTGIACVKTGHSFTGIEREEEFLAIADARVRHWDRAEAGWNGAEILSDHEAPGTGGSKDVDLADLLW